MCDATLVVLQYPALAHQQATPIERDDLAIGSHSILQRHRGIFSQLSIRSYSSD
jgi:hypothetical protein